MKIKLIIILFMFLNCSFAYSQSNGGKEKKEKLISNVKISSLSELKEQKEAEGTLGKLLSEINNTRKSTKERKRGVNREELKSLAEFAKKYPSSKSALFSKYLIGYLIFLEGKPEEFAKCRESFEDILQNYPGSVEAELSKINITMVRVREAQDNDKIKELLQNLCMHIESSLSLAKKMDKDNSNIMNGFRRLAFGSTEEKMELLFKLDLAAMKYDLGEKEKSIDYYSGIIREYPKSKWASKAKRRLDTIEFLEKNEK